MTPELEAWLEESGPVVCEIPTHRYTCYYCNHGYDVDDPEFVYYKTFGENHFLVKLGLVRPGDQQRLRFVEPREGRYSMTTFFPAGHDTHAWFSHCADRERCARYRANVEADVHYEQEALAI